MPRSDRTDQNAIERQQLADPSDVLAIAIVRPIWLARCRPDPLTSMGSREASAYEFESQLGELSSPMHSNFLNEPKARNCHRAMRSYYIHLSA